MLSYYYEQVRKKQDDISRLQDCQAILQDRQQEFMDGQYRCLEPKLHVHNWHGKHASDFQDIRESGIQEPYREIAANQLNKVFSRISNKITSLNMEIASLERRIDRLEAEREARKNRP
ncbi:DUF5082 family protein [Bacillaceae bacterium Marseille-Q3522]|nr:DUF5082 family protein [Bacillaceae bacterium Marseille-Q3522]